MDITRIFDLLDNYKELFPSKEDALAGKENGFWKKYSSQDYYNASHYISYGLMSLSLQKGDRVATVSNNRPEWNFVDMALSQSGFIHVPIYPTISEEDYMYILKHAEPKVLIVSDKLLYEKLSPIADNLEHSILIFSYNQIEGVKNWKDILELGKQNEDKYKTRLYEIKQSIQPDDMTTLIYTSGTTGKPKGVMLSHKNIISNLKAVDKRFNFNETQCTLSFLPICHVFERTVNYYYQYRGLSIYYAENLGTIADNLKDVKPHVFVTVPRLLERVYDKIISKGRELKGTKRKIFNWSLKVGDAFNPAKRLSLLYSLKLFIANKLVFSKWREALGGRVELIVSGSAALQPRLFRMFNAARIPLMEGYGLTETSPVIAVNNVLTGEIRAGTVGIPVDNVKVKITEDGEILCMGPNVMKGYYKEPELTLQAIDDEGWFHTGDIGVFIESKYLKITDRKKEIFKLSSGKYVAPQVIENKFKESFFIEQLMVIGENEKFASALIVPNFQYLHNWCTKNQINFRDNKEMINNPKVQQQYQKEVNAINKQLGQTENIKRFRLMSEEWGPLSGELSPTLKLKRKTIASKYAYIIEEIYSVQKD